MRIDIGALSQCRFDMPYYSFEILEHDALGGASGGQVILGPLTILTGMGVSLPVQFNPAPPDNPFQLFFNVLTAPARESFDREVRDLYVLPVMSTLGQETAYATVSSAGNGFPADLPASCRQYSYDEPLLSSLHSHHSPLSLTCPLPPPLPPLPSLPPLHVHPTPPPSGHSEGHRPERRVPTVPTHRTHIQCA